MAIEVPAYSHSDMGLRGLVFGISETTYKFNKEKFLVNMRFSQSGYPFFRFGFYSKDLKYAIGFEVARMDWFYSYYRGFNLENGKYTTSDKEEPFMGSGNNIAFGYNFSLNKDDFGLLTTIPSLSSSGLQYFKNNETYFYGLFGEVSGESWTNVRFYLLDIEIN